MIVASPPSLGPQSNAVRDCPLLSPFFLTPAGSPHQDHSRQFSLLLFSYSYALFCTLSSRIPLLFNRFRTLFAKHRGWGGASSTSPLCAHAGIPATPVPSIVYFITRGHPRVGGYPISQQLPHSPASAIIVGLNNDANSTSAAQRGYPRSHDAA